MTLDVTARIDQLIQERSLLKHPFYQAWNKGELSIDSLREYAGQYYFFERAYPTYLSGLHFRCDNAEVRKLLLQNLWDEEYGDDNHVELWMRFCDALGLDRGDIETGSQKAATVSLTESYKQLTSTGSVIGGATALYVFESQVPEIADAKISGLKKHYGIHDEKQISFFEVHKSLDEEHAEAEREMIGVLVNDKSDEIAALNAADIATLKLWQFLDGVY